MATDDALTRDVLALASALIERPSVSPNDHGCQELLLDRLTAIGFTAEKMPFGAVDNFWATHGQGEPTLVFAGHTDVVPSGPEVDWLSPPFQPTLRDGYLYGRGAADMKSSLAAMVTAAARFVAQEPDHIGTLAFLITSDEEADAIDGTVKVVEALVRRQVPLHYCVVGEPSSTARVGDIVRIGRRGSLSGTATVAGVQGHVAYPDQARNPIHAACSALAALTAREWDSGDAEFPPTSFQVSNLHAGTGAGNVIPGELVCHFNFRFNPAQTPEALRDAVAQAFEATGFDCQFDWRLSGLPFITRGGKLIAAVRAAIADVAGVETQASTSGGTSDGRFIAPTGAEVVELGPVNETIHKLNERILVADLAPLTKMYEQVARRLLTSRPS